MPVTKSAKKALRRAIRNKRFNDRKRKELKKAVKLFRAKPSKTLLSRAFSAIDKAAKINVIHKNKAARIKSKLTKLLSTRSS